MTHSYELEGDTARETLDGIETALWEALAETDSAEACYRIRSSLQKIQVLREAELRNGTDSDGSA